MAHRHEALLDCKLA